MTGRTCWSCYDYAVCAEVDHFSLVDCDGEADEAGKVALVDYGVVEGYESFEFFVVAVDCDSEESSVVDVVCAFENFVEGFEDSVRFVKFCEESECA